MSTQLRCGCNWVNINLLETDGYKTTCTRHKISWNNKDGEIDSLKSQLKQSEERVKALEHAIDRVFHIGSSSIRCSKILRDARELNPVKK